MPIYEYQCSSCCHQFEMIHGASDGNLKIVCPKCGAANPERVVSTFSCGGSKSMEDRVQFRLWPHARSL